MINILKSFGLYVIATTTTTTIGGTGKSSSMFLLHFVL